MRNAVLLAAILGCCGCKGKPVSPSIPVAASAPVTEQSHADMKMSEAEPITHWRAVAHSKGLRWRIECSDHPHTPNQLFWGYAFPDGSPENGYIEDGAKPYWDAYGKTQEIVAAKLYSLVQGPPNQIPEHRPAWKPDEKECPVPLKGN